jgi:hypothetical protein
MCIFVRILLTSLALVSGGVFASDSAITFSPTPTTRATLRVNDHSVTFDISALKTGEHHGEIDIDTENQIHVVVDNYSFDKRKGFSIWSIDEGMGVYTIHRIFLYSDIRATFVEAHPACGDQFINLKVDKKRRRLTSTYYEGNVPKLCITRLPKIDDITR